MTNEAARDLLGALLDAWAARDPACVAGLFDGDDAAAGYLDAGEIDPWIGVAAIERAAVRKCSKHARFAFKIHAPQTRHLADDLASVFALVDRAEAEKDGDPLEAQRVRITLVARRRGADWKICHYAEAPKAPLIELEAYYQGIAADGLEAAPPRPWGPP